MSQHPTTPARRPHQRRPALAVLLLVLALVLSGCGWFSGEEETPVAEATPAPVEQPDPDVEVIGAEDVEVGEAQPAESPGQGLYFVSSLYELTGPELDQPVLVRMVLDSGLPAGTPLAVAAREDDDSPWEFLEGRLDDDRRHVEFIVSGLGSFGVLAIDTASVSGALADRVAGALESDAEKPEGVPAPTCAAADPAREDGYSARSWKRSTVGWCLDKLGDERVLRVTNTRGVPVRVTAPGGLDRGQTGETVRDVPWTAWIEAVGTAAGAEPVPGDSTDALLAPGRTLSIDADLEPGTELLVTAGDDPAGRTVQVLHAAARALSAQVRTFGVRQGAVPSASKVLATWLSTRSCSRVVGKQAAALVRGCLGEQPLTKAYGSVALLLGPAARTPATRSLLQERLDALEAAAGQVEQRIQVSREEPDFGELVGRFAGTERSLEVSPEGVVTETFGRDGKQVITLTYQLSDPAPQAARATATITSVRVQAPRLLGGPAPRVGQTGTLSLVKGIVRPPFLRTTYCDADRAAQGRCTDPEPVTTEPAADEETPGRDR